MNKTYLIAGLMLAVVAVCAYLLVPSLLTDPVQTTPVTTQVQQPETWSGDTESRVLGWGMTEPESGQESGQQLEADRVDATLTPMLDNKQYDQERWESGGKTLKDRVNNYLAGKDLPKMEQSLDLRARVKLFKPNKKELYDELRKSQLEDNNADAWTYVKFSPEMIGDEVVGLRLADTQATDFLAMHDLYDGDLITAVNGRKLDTYEAAFESINIINASNHFQLAIDRGGEQVNINVDKNSVKFENEESNNE